MALGRKGLQVGRFADKTKVPVVRSRIEVARIIERAGGDELLTASSSRHGVEVVQFTLDERQVKLTVRIPEDDPQEHRRRWRALVLILKAKLELISSGDSTVDREFMADLLLPAGGTLGDHVLPELAAHYRGAVLPLLPKKLLGGGK